jgi:lysophospholipase L1-like esterase
MRANGENQEKVIRPDFNRANINDITKSWTTRKLLFLSLVTILGVFLVLEACAFFFFLFRGQVKGNLAFHPLFRTIGYQSTTFKDDRFTFDPFLSYRFKPNTRYGNLVINEHGFIGNGGNFPDLFAKKKDICRIFILGGSSVAGSGASNNDKTITAQLENLLNNRLSQQFEVINAGVDGYFSFNELSYFLFDIIWYQPDIVIFYNGYNDYAYSNWSGGYKDEYQKLHNRPNFHEYALYLLTVFPKLEKQQSTINLDIVFSKLYLTSLMRKIINKFLNTASLNTNIDVRSIRSKVRLSPEEAAILYASNIESALGAAMAHKIKIIYALQPTLINKQVLTGNERIIINTRPVFNLQWSNAETINRFYEASRSKYAKLQQKVNSNNVQVIDLSAQMWQGVSDEIYLDEVHTNDYGNYIIADALFDIITQKLGYR